MIAKTIEIDEKQVEFRASAAVPRLYRFKFRRDIIRDIMKLRKAFVANQTGGKEFEVIDLELFENIAYIMAKHADKNVPDSVEEWLDGFNMFSIYEVVPALLELWMLNEETMSEAKKKLAQVKGI